MKDSEEIARVERNRGWIGGIKFDALERTKNLFKEKGVIVAVALKSKRIVGYRAFIKKGKTANPGYLSIEKSFQDKGLGTALLNYSVKYAKRIGCNKMIIFVNNDNFRAINIYNRLQFKIVQIIQRNAKTKLKMEKKLK